MNYDLSLLYTPTIKKFSNIKNRIRNLFVRSPKQDVFQCSILDIHSKAKYPSNVLSNFHKSHFRFDDVEIHSMEGFLQSLKTSDLSLQRKICLLEGIEAKKAGENLSEIYDKKHIFWNGKKMDRYSEEYQNLLKDVYLSKFNQDSLFRQAIKDTKDKKLVHSIGKQEKSETILTEQEFIQNLVNLRNYL